MKYYIYQSIIGPNFKFCEHYYPQQIPLSAIKRANKEFTFIEVTL